MEKRVSKAQWEAGQANHRVLKECPTLVTGASAILTMGIPMPPSDSSLGTAIPLNHSSTVVQVPTLEGTKVGINCTGEVLKPTTTKRLQGYGLPLPKEPNKRGDLIVSFDVLFPDQLSQSSKDIIYDVLS